MLFLFVIYRTNNAFELSYRTCKNNYILCFTLKTNQIDLIIEKIVIIRSRWINYVRNEDVPFQISPSMLTSKEKKK